MFQISHSRIPELHNLAALAHTAAAVAHALFLLSKTGIPRSTSRSVSHCWHSRTPDVRDCRTAPLPTRCGGLSQLTQSDPLTAH